jgi:hypothetical protein
MNYFRLILLILVMVGQRNHAMSMEPAIASSELSTAGVGQPVKRTPPPEITLGKIVLYVAGAVLCILLLVLKDGHSDSDADKDAANAGSPQSTNWQDRVLDAGSQMNMWEAVKRGDSEALREELKLMELRAIRRQNQR